MHYDGSLQSNGQQFDSSRKRGRPFEFTVGAGQVIKGWDLGLLDMCPGEKRESCLRGEMVERATVADHIGDLGLSQARSPSRLSLATGLVGLEA